MTGAPLSAAQVRKILRLFLGHRGAKTQSCYRTDFRTLADFLHLKSDVDTIGHLIPDGTIPRSLLRGWMPPADIGAKPPP
jgi:hypothetical protein